MKWITPGLSPARLFVALVVALLSFAVPRVPTSASSLPAGTFHAVPAPSPNIPGDPNVSMSDVSCASTRFCVAVGSVLSRTGLNEASIYTLAGGTWKAALAPFPPDASRESAMSLEAVHCFYDDSCEAVGVIQHGESVPKVVVLGDSHGSWKAADHFSAPAIVQGPTFGMSLGCLSESSCVITGAYFGRKNGTAAALGVGLGLHWSFQAIPSVTLAGRRYALSAAGADRLLGHMYDRYSLLRRSRCRAHCRGFRQTRTLERSGVAAATRYLGVRQHHS